LDSAGGDNTAFIDDVALASMPSVGDAGFEQVVVGAGQFQYRPTGSAWAFTGAAGISGNNSGFTSGNPQAPQGSQVAFLQQTSSISQSVAGWLAGSYVISFDAAQRGNFQASHQDFQVLVDGTVVGTFTPSSTSYQTYSTSAFTVAAGSHTIEFQSLDSAGGDNTVLIDAIRVAQVPAGFLRADATTQGTWIGTYGAQGTDIPGYAAALPDYAVIGISNVETTTWSSSTTDPRAPRDPANPAGGRVAACWNSASGSSFTIDVNLTDGRAHDLALYFLDWFNRGQVESVQLSDAATGAVLDTETVASFGGGEYLQWRVSGHVLIRVTATGGTNAVLSGLFLDPTPPTAVHSMTVSGPTVDGNGVKYYTVVSGYLGDRPTTLRILEPTDPAPGEPHRFLYVLPVQAGVTTLSSQYGDGLEQARLLNLQNLYNLTLVAPSFPIVPWYGDNDNDPSARLESFLVKDVVPFIDQLDAAGADPERWMVGFSKSGFGALTLIFRHPDVFDDAAAWDAPAQFTSLQLDMGPTFGDQANFVQYEIPGLVANDNAPFLSRNRIWISGDTANFTAQMATLDQQMTSAGVLHTFVGGVVRDHSWSSGWLQIAIGDLANTDAASI
jgi:S-formylglutathione hydrolase FrmB